MPSDTSKIRDMLDHSEPVSPAVKKERKAKKQMEQEEEDDVSIPVPGNMYELVFEEAFALTPPGVEAEMGLMNFYVINDRFMPSVMRKMAEDCESSFGIVARIAILHGFSMFLHEKTEFISLMRALDNASLSEVNGAYHKHLNQKVGLGKDVKRIPVAIEKTTMHEMGEIAALIGTSRSHLAGACIMMSLLTSGSYSPSVRKQLEDQLYHFNITLTLFETCANTLATMRK